jgi:hypothetical protein
MNGHVALTDDNWFEALSAQGAREANVWKPSGTRFRALSRGEGLFFLLKQPRQIGCIVLEDCVWFSEQDFVRPPDVWQRNTVSGKGYGLHDGEGRRIWSECLARTAVQAGATPSIQDSADAARYGLPQLVQPRLGQGAFRLEVMEAYAGACAVTTEHSLPVLEAAHIRAFAAGGPHDVLGRTVTTGGGRDRKSRGRKSRGRKSRGRKSRGRKSRGRKSRRAAGLLARPARPRVVCGVAAVQRASASAPTPRVSCGLRTRAGGAWSKAPAGSDRAAALPTRGCRP